ncbi:noncanonical pyrimidine nucleotidase, YjjG family protein [Brevibacillus agri]|uniref:Noncanonical pyrimidine nucleotidase, YjjG family protein n=1 Tax=Brevibacillus agri TaxID=51101 RepID=A0ABQ0SQW3_9BACL|nr:noncanonical pyrimidine nucleotidase, YjjG family protein [Brevibacillus agri]
MERAVKYDVIFFDVDDTLMDFDLSEKNALDKAFREFGWPEGMTDYEAAYREINKGLWRELEQGGITLAELGVERFKRLFAAHELSGDAEAFNRLYLANLGQEVHLLPGAVDVCSRLADCRLAIITNGFAEVQTSRIRLSPLQDAFEQIIISQEAGFQKPDQRIFDYAFSRLALTDKKKVLMVGDSLTSDIQGGHNYGIDTCWYNPHGKENHLGITPTYEIRDLTNLLGVVGSSVEKIIHI